MDWAQFVVQWLHVLAAILWFGAALYTASILIPAISSLPLPRQREIGERIGRQAFRVLRPAASAVIILGILRGTVFGPIKSLEVLGSTYGITWLVALVFAIVTFFWAESQIAPALARMNAIPEADALGPDGTPTPELAAAVSRVKLVTVLELGLFLVIFTCMILMRFGL